ncbi:hypothetical protein GOBAR_DD34479 [Gossypium barbadense]|nr:hypothetical protein GOBAR_DD34479 [Gossypium barbadense]
MLRNKKQRFSDQPIDRAKKREIRKELLTPSKLWPESAMTLDSAISCSFLPHRHIRSMFDSSPGSPPLTQSDSAPSRVKSVKAQWDKLTGALPLSIFGEEEKEDGGSDAVDAGFNADLYKEKEKGNEANGFRSGVDVKKAIDLNSKAETWNWNGLNSGLNGSGLKVDALDLSINGPASVKKEENLGSNGYAFGKERKEVNMGLSGLDLSSYGSSWGQEGLNLDSNAGNSVLVDEEDDDGWEFKGAEPKAEAAAENLKSNPNVPMSNFNMSTSSWDPLGTNTSVLSSNINGVEDQDREKPQGAEFSFGFGNGANGSSDFFGTSDGISKKPGEWDLGFSFSPSFESQSKQNDTKDGEISSSAGINIGSGEMSWAFKDATFGHESKAKEEPRVADASSSAVEGNFKENKAALPLSIFGDEEIETEDPLKHEDVSILKPTTTNAGLKDTRSNISINDLISSLYSQSETNTSLNPISNPSENGLLSSQIDVGSSLVNGDSFDDDSWEFKGAVSGTGGENQNSSFSFGDSYEKYTIKTELNDYLDLYSKLTTELCFVALSHLENMKKDKSTAAPSGEDAEVKAIEEEILGLYNELQKDGIISEEVTSENLQSRSIHLGEYAKVLLEKKFQVLESEYQLSEKLSLAEKNMASTIELLKHAASTLKVLKLGSAEDQSYYVSMWLRILTVCALELKHGSMIWKQSLQKNIHRQLLSKPQGRQYILALGEIYRVVKIVGSLSAKLCKPWILFSSENPTNFPALVRECSSVWSSSGLEEALQNLTDLTDLKYDVEALLGSIQSIHDPDAHELYKQVFSEQESTCCLSGLTAGAVPGMKMVLWDGRHYFVTIVNLWANLISRDPPNLPLIHARK